MAFFENLSGKAENRKEKIKATNRLSPNQLALLNKIKNIENQKRSSVSLQGPVLSPEEKKAREENVQKELEEYFIILQKMKIKKHTVKIRFPSTLQEGSGTPSKKVKIVGIKYQESPSAYTDLQMNLERKTSDSTEKLEGEEKGPKRPSKNPRKKSPSLISIHRGNNADELDIKLPPRRLPIRLLSKKGINQGNQNNPYQRKRTIKVKGKELFLLPKAPI